MSLIVYCIGNPLFSGPALVTQCEHITNWLRINILLTLERRIQGVWHLRICFIFRVHTQAAGYSSQRTCSKQVPLCWIGSMLKVRVPRLARPPRPFLLAPSTLPPEPGDIIEAKKKKRMCCHMFRFPVSWLLTLGPKQHCCVGNSTLCKKLDGCC